MLAQQPRARIAGSQLVLVGWTPELLRMVRSHAFPRTRLRNRELGISRSRSCHGNHPSYSRVFHRGHPLLAGIRCITADVLRGKCNPEEVPISARNQLEGKIVSVTLGDIMAHVVVKIGKSQIESVITRASAEDLGLKKGDSVKVVIKSTEVMLQKDA